MIPPVRDNRASAESGTRAHANNQIKVNDTLMFPGNGGKIKTLHKPNRMRGEKQKKKKKKKKKQSIIILEEYVFPLLTSM